MGLIQLQEREEETAGAEEEGEVSALYALQDITAY